MTNHSSQLYIGLMSGTSLDGVDGVISSFSDDGKINVHFSLTSAYVPFTDALRADVMALQSSGWDEIHREAMIANALAKLYAECVSLLLEKANLKPDAIRAIGVHGQTIRHRPVLGYSRQTNNPALLAELTGIDVIADFRSRDLAAGGQGAPLVPAFHHAVFYDPTKTRAIANIGGISNISILHAGNDERGVIGFHTGPGNVLMDSWIRLHQGKNFDAAGTWAASGTVHDALLDKLRSNAFFDLMPPKSTGRDLFHAEWLSTQLATFEDLPAADVQATLAAFTASTIADAIAKYAPATQDVYVCGGGAYNSHLMQQLQSSLQARELDANVTSTEMLGVSPNHVESFAFAWLAHRFTTRQPGNLAAVTGAAGARILGALYPGEL